MWERAASRFRASYAILKVVEGGRLEVRKVAKLSRDPAF
jgi:hypothetical protein